MLALRPESVAAVARQRSTAQKSAWRFTSAMTWPASTAGPVLKNLAA